MRWHTHALCGIASLWLLAPLPQSPTVDYGVLSACAAFGALLPDLDAAESKIKHLPVGTVAPFALPAQLLYRTLGHRGLLHSLWGLAAFAVLALPVAWLWDWRPWAAVTLGYASHLAADACTKSGIPLFYPRRQRYSPLPRPWRITTGSLAEDMLFPFLAAAVLLLLLTHLNAVPP